MMTRKPATYAELLEVPETKVAEVFGGELVVSPRPSLRHAHASSELGAELIGHFGGRRSDRQGWRILDEPELHLGADILVPDLAGWRRERMPDLPDQTACTIAPDWLCEVLSPSTETIDRTRKLPLYAAAGVRHAWLVDPIARRLEVLRLEQGRWLHVGTWSGGALLRAEPFEEAEIDLLGLWDEERQG